MSRTVQGRLVRAGGDAAAGATVELVVPGSAARVRARAGNDGGFTLALDGADEDGAADGRLVLRIRDALGGSQDVAVPEGAGGDLVVVMPEPPTDPREQVRQVVELVEAQDEAADQAREALAERTDARVALEKSTRKAVGRVLTAIGRRAGGDLKWRFDGSQPMPKMLRGAVETGRGVLANRPRSVLAEEGVLNDGESLGTGELMAKLAGDPARRDGYWRASPVDRLRLRQQLRGPDGLPVPASGSAPQLDGAGRPVARNGVPPSVTDKVTALVEAVRLPEDPPILGAGSAVNAPGAEVELARGVADVTAFRDVHELAMAMPDIWQEVFDRRSSPSSRQRFGTLSRPG